MLGESLLGLQYDDREPTATATARTENGRPIEVRAPTLAEYLTLCPRRVTPIYPGDAAVLVSLLGLDVALPGEDDGGDGSVAGLEEGEGSPRDDVLEIFEAGTGHGSLTLHLARALHAANPPLPVKLRKMLATAPHATVTKQADEPGPSGVLDDPHPLAFPSPSEEGAPDDDHYQIDYWKRRLRRAVVHTLDADFRHSRHAHDVVRRFGRGRYAGDIEFYVGSVRQWVDARLAQQQGRPRPFLAHAILDLPSPEDEVAAVASALRVGGRLLVWCPSVTQIVRVLERVKGVLPPASPVQQPAASQGDDKAPEVGSGSMTGRSTVPLTLERVLELPPSTGTALEDGGEAAVAAEVAGAREWDLRLVTRRRDREQETQQQEKVVVCRPKVGAQVVGGGFVGVFRRVTDD